MIPGASAEQQVLLVDLVSIGVCVLLAWHAPWFMLFRYYVVGIHETWHAIGAIATLNGVVSIELTADEGGVTTYTVRSWNARVTSALVLPAGYMGTPLMGSLLIISSGTGVGVAISGILCALVSTGLLVLLLCGGNTPQKIVFCVGVVIAITAVCTASYATATAPLRVWLLCLGVLQWLYGLHDIYDDTLARVVDASDVSEFSKLCPCWATQTHARVWFTLVLVMGVCSVAVPLVYLSPGLGRTEAVCFGCIHAVWPVGALCVMWFTSACNLADASRLIVSGR